MKYYFYNIIWCYL